MSIQDLGNAYRLKITREIAAALAELRIFRQGPTGHTPEAEASPVLFLKSTTVEPYSSFIGKGNFATIGSFSYTHSRLPVDLTIGRYCSIAGGLSVFGEQHPTDRATTSVWSYRRANVVVGSALEDFGVKDFPLDAPSRKHAPIIGNDVWIGERVMLARGITIGDGAILGASAVVTKSVEPFTIVAGNPARVIRGRFSDSLCERYLRARWWDYALPEMVQPNLLNPERFIGQVEDESAAGRLRQYKPQGLSADRLLTLVREIERVC